MKLKILLFTILFETLVLADATNETQALDKVFASINKQRHGLEKERIKETKNPFIVQKEIEDKNTTKKKKSEYTLKAILNNRAFINDTWVSLYHTIDEYKLIKINHDNVTLDSGGVEKKLQIQGDKNDNISIK